MKKTSWGRDRENPFGTKGALLYMGKPCMCVLRGRQPGRLKSGLFCVTSFRTSGCTPCDACASIPTDLLCANGFDKPFAHNKF